MAAPISLGTSGANSTDVGAKVCCLGTLGSLWTKAGVTNPVILSNNHVLDKSGNGVPGQAINQPLQLACTNPNSPGPLTVANLTQGLPIKPVANETTGPCAGNKTPLCGHGPSNVDAATAETIPGQVDRTGTILDLGSAGATTIAAAPPSGTIGVASLGETVGKSGRTSGLTCSTVESLSLTILIDYGICGLWWRDSQRSRPITATRSLSMAGPSAPVGDSGSAIVDTNYLPGLRVLLYGGSPIDTVGNPIQDVITAFGGSANTFNIVGGGDHPISCAHSLRQCNAKRPGSVGPYRFQQQNVSALP